jgi:hypothetical protein
MKIVSYSIKVIVDHAWYTISITSNDDRFETEIRKYDCLQLNQYEFQELFNWLEDLSQYLEFEIKDQFGNQVKLKSKYADSETVMKIYENNRKKYSKYFDELAEK